MKSVLYIVLLLPLLVPLTGCGGKKKEMEASREAVTADQVIPPAAVERVDLTSLLDPDDKARKRAGRRVWRKFDEGRKLDLALEAFYYGYREDDRELRRNRAQDRIFTASDQYCDYFKNYLLMNRKRPGFLRTVGGLASAAGAIVGGVGASAALRGMRTVFGGGNSRFSEEMFVNVTMQVITDGIDLRRRSILKRILDEGQSSPIEEYTVEAAIKDAMAYHSQCNVLVGMEVARERILMSGQ